MNFSAAVVAASMKPCIVIVIDTNHEPMPLTYISRFTDFVKFNVESRKFYVESRNKMDISAAMIPGSIKPCIVIALDTVFKHAPRPQCT